MLSWDDIFFENDFDFTIAVPFDFLDHNAVCHGWFLPQARAEHTTSPFDLLKLLLSPVRRARNGL
jgi:hypothetical protein